MSEAPQESPSFMDRIKEAPTWLTITVGAIVAIFVIAAIAGGGEDEELRDQISAVEEREEALEDELATEKSRVELLREQRDRAEQAAQNALKTARQEVRETLANRMAALDERSQELNNREANLDERAAELTAEEEREAKRIIREDGIWQTDVDFTGGTYRSTGGAGCYWAKLSDPSGSFESIIANGSGANQTVTIDSPWFETTRCGTWEPVD